MRKKVTLFDSDWELLIADIDKWKKDFLNDFCLKKCKKDCCDMEHRGLSERQVRKIFSFSDSDDLYGQKNRYGESVIQKDEDGTFRTDLCYGNRCPALKEDGLCNIYSSELKPDYCGNFPFYYTLEDGEKVLEVSACPAVKALDTSMIVKSAEKKGIIVRTLL